LGQQSNNIQNNHNNNNIQVKRVSEQRQQPQQLRHVGYARGLIELIYMKFSYSFN